MPEQTTDTGAAADPLPPVPDLGFFAGAPQPAAGFGQPGGHPVQGTHSAFGPPSTQFGAAPSPFAPSAALGQATSPFGPPAVAPATNATGGGLATGWKIAAAAGAVVLLLAVVLGGRFGWQQFVADPVAPPTLLGLPRVSGASGDEISAQLQDSMGGALSDGSKVAAAFYSDGPGTGYLLVALRGGSRPGSSSDDNGDPFDGWTKSTSDGASCFTAPAEVTAVTGTGTTLCMRGLWRRAVLVFGISTPGPATVARATNEAWDAQ